MSEVPVQLVVAAFQDEKSAQAALIELQQAQKEKLIKIENAAVLRKDAKGKLHIKETADMGGSKGATIGGVAWRGDRSASRAGAAGAEKVLEIANEHNWTVVSIQSDWQQVFPVQVV